MTTILRIGSQGPAVLALQQALLAAGFNPRGLDADYGMLTAAAVAGYQRAHPPLVVDGVAGPRTLAALGLAGAPAPADNAPPTQPTGAGPLRLVRPGTGALVVAYFIADTAALLRALPPDAAVLVDNHNPSGRFARTPGAGGVDPLSVARTLASLPAPSATILIGWSAGCQAVREQLRAGARPDVVLALDGTSGAVPPTVAQLAPWVEAAEQAQRGRCLTIITATQQVYTRDLPAAQRFESTLYVASEVWHSRRPSTPADLLAPGEYRAGDLVVAVHPSGRIDGDAHRREQRDHMPDLIGRVVVPWLAARGAPARVETGATTLGQRALALSLAELAADVREEPSGSNDGPRQRVYRTGAMRNGRPLAAGPGPWCAYGACWAAYAAGAGAPHGWRASVAELIADAREAGAWHPAESDYEPAPGDLACFGRAGGDPRRGGTGHVGRVEASDAATVTTIDANVGDRWARVTRARGAVLGWIAYPSDVIG